MDSFIHDTIVAVASAPGSAPRGIVRLSGPDSLALLLRALKSPAQVPIDLPRGTHVCDADLEIAGERPLACRLYIWNTTASFTREPTIEVHTIGSPPLLSAVVETFCQQGARLARPGEFTLRAFLAGRIDLTQAESVLGVIDARSERELSVALEQLAGGLSSPLATIRESLLNLLADLEAELDFAEEDIHFIDNDTLHAILTSASTQLNEIQRRMSDRTRNSNQLRVVLYGPPNAGKSSLFNALTSQGKAIVSPVAGTTRDYLTAEMEIASGHPCTLTDTAGFEADSGEDLIQQTAQSSLAKQRASAHIRLLCVDGSQPLDAWSLAELSQSDERRLILQTKCDQPSAWHHGQAIPVSVSPPTGLDTVQQNIRALLEREFAYESEIVTATALRCRDALQRSAASLSELPASLQRGDGREFLAGDIRLVLDDLGLILGAIVTDDILDRIFSRFCIGK